jgi:two-component system response regulator DesR
MHEELPGCRAVILTSHGRPGHLKRALAGGVPGFLPKTISAEILADVVRTVHGGGRYVDPHLAAICRRRRESSARRRITPCWRRA